MATKFINLTEHEINFRLEMNKDGSVYEEMRLPPSGILCRVSTVKYFTGIHVSIPGKSAPSLSYPVPVYRTKFDKVENLPEPVDRTVYIVSAMVSQALLGSRLDVICPDTGNTAKRNEKGQIEYVTQFTTY